MNSKLVLAVVLLILPTTVFAQTGFYAGLGIGYVDLGQDETDIGAAAGAAGVAGQVTDLDDSGFAWKLFGGYQFNDYFAGELGYTDLGDAEATFVATAPTAATVNMQADVSALSASLVGMYPLNRDFGVFARLGAAYWTVDGTAAAAVGGATVTANADEDGFDMLFGLGTQYNLNEQTGLRLEWEHYRGIGDESSGTDGNTNVFGGSFLYRF